MSRPHGTGDDLTGKPTDTTGGDGSTSLRRRAASFVKWSLTILVFAFVTWRAWKLWRDGSPGQVEIHVGWLALSGAFYIVGWLPSVWFWRTVLARMGDEVPWSSAAAAYYVGHLGKYVPGKALVPIIRGRMIAADGGRFGAAVLAVVYETIVMMGVGAEVATALIAFLLPADLDRSPALLREIVERPAVRWLLGTSWAVPTIVLVGVLASLPVVARLFSWAARKFAPVRDVTASTRGIDAKLIGLGFLAFSAAWVVHGLSLWATLRGVGAGVEIRDLPAWTASVALATFAGFLAVFAPGGAGVREGFLIEVLKIQPGIDGRQAVAAALMLRLVWLIAEVAAAVVLYYGVRSRGARTPDARPPSAAPPAT